LDGPESPLKKKKKLFRPPPSTSIHIRTIVTKDAVFALEKHAHTIYNLSGVNITSNECPIGVQERVLTVSGAENQVSKVRIHRNRTKSEFCRLVCWPFKAFALISRIVNGEPVDSVSTARSIPRHISLLIPDILIGPIITQLLHIQAASGTIVNISDNCLPLSTERSVVICGLSEGVRIATYYVASSLVTQLAKDFGGPAASAYGTSAAAASIIHVAPYIPPFHIEAQSRPSSSQSRPQASLSRWSPYSGGPSTVRCRGKRTTLLIPSHK
jgi:heterogeneous nuclear rnp K-like protein